MDRLRRLISEIHRRSLWKVLGVYAAAAWVALEVAATLTETFGLPAWFPAFALGLLVIGLPVVLATAVVQEGARPMDPRQPDPGEPPARAPRESFTAHRGLTWRNALLGGVGALALWGLVAGGWLLVGAGPARPGGTAAAERGSIAVLPFENLSASEEDRYFADGIHDEILTHLAHIGDLKVISRTSVMEYRDTPKNLRTIAAELGVTSILEGSVRRDRERVLITAQLIDARTDEHIWAESYERSLADIFAIQADVARRIASALQAELTPGESARLERRPTENLEAYDFYLRGNDYYARGFSPENNALAIRMYETAVQIDPAFAEAYAAEARVRASSHWFGYDGSDENLLAAKAAVERALELDPDLPEAHLALGIYHYLGRREYDLALRELERAASSLPDLALQYMAYVQRRQGQWEQSTGNLERLLELDPRSADIALNLAYSYMLLRRYEEAAPLFERAIALAPDWARGFTDLALLELLWRGDARRAGEILDRAPPGANDPAVAEVWFEVDRAARNYAEGLERLREGFPELMETQYHYLPRILREAELLEALGRADSARIAYDSARALLEGAARERPEDARVRTSLARALAGLDRRNDALREGRAAVELMPVSREAIAGAFFLTDLAATHAAVGDPDSAVAVLGRVLSIPAHLSPALLRTDPRWDPLRRHPGFQKLVEK